MPLTIISILLTLVPPLAWLFFYLREDQHPEPKLLLLVVFIGGMLSAIVAAFAECGFARLLLASSCNEHLLESNTGLNLFFLFGGIALIEEYAKYLVVKLIVFRRAAFDEPIDAMIYLMTAAMGFAALENLLFTLPLIGNDALAGFELVSNRFIGANLLHALSSGIVGFFLARAWFTPHRRHFVALGMCIASLLHVAFNYLILTRETFSQAPLYLVLLLAVMAVMVFIDFERLKRIPVKFSRVFPPALPVRESPPPSALPTKN